MTPAQSQPFPGVPEQLIYKKNTPPAPKQANKVGILIKALRSRISSRLRTMLFLFTSWLVLAYSC